MGRPATDAQRGFRSGSRLGRFSLGPRLARGGMGELYAARADGVERFSKLLAVKVLLPQLTDDPELVPMFLHEARLAAQLDHPNIAAVVELGVEEGDYFIAMEYVHGRNLRTILRDAAEPDAPALPLPCALYVVTRACAGLHYAHRLVDASGTALGIVHRDVTPSNVVVRYDGEVKLVDFGIAKAVTGTKLTRTGTLKGTPSYMSPEQCLEGVVDARSDIWGLGVVLYEASTGRKLFVGDNDFAIMGRVMRAQFPKPSEVVPDYPPELEAIVLRALALDPAERYADALELADALESFARRSNLVLSPAAMAVRMEARFGAPPLPVVHAVARTTRRRMWPLALAGSLAVLGAGATAWTTSSVRAVDPNPAPGQAQTSVVSPAVATDPAPTSTDHHAGEPAARTKPAATAVVPPREPVPSPSPGNAAVGPQTTSAPTKPSPKKPKRRARPARRKTSPPNRDLDALLPPPKRGV